MDKFYNLATGQVEEVNPSKVTSALGLTPWRDEDGNPSDVTPEQVKQTHALLKDTKYSYFDPNNADQYEAKSPENYLTALEKGAVPWDPVLEEAYNYKQELRKGGLLTSAEKFKGLTYKLVNSRFLGIPGAVQDAAYSGTDADVRATRLKRAILDQELGVTGQIADIGGMMTSGPTKLLSKAGTKLLDKYAGTAFAKSVEGSLVKKAVSNIAIRAGVGAVESGGYTAIEKTAQAFVPENEEQFTHPQLWAEHTIADLAKVPGETLESAKFGAVAGGAIRAGVEVPGLIKKGVSSAVTPLWKGFAGVVNSKGENLGEYADTLGSGQFIPKGSKAEAMQESIGKENFNKNVEFLKKNWDNTAELSGNKPLVKKIIQTADETVEAVKDALQVAHEKMNAFVDRVSAKSDDFTFDDVLDRSQSKLDELGPKSTWRPGHEQAVANRVDQIVINEILEGFPRSPEAKGYTLAEMRQIKKFIGDRANWKNKLDNAVTNDEKAYRIVDRAIDDHIVKTLDDIGAKVGDSNITGKAYQDYKRAQSAYMMAAETVSAKKNSLWSAAPLAASGAVTGLLVQGLLGGDFVSPQGLVAGMVGSLMSLHYGRNFAAKGLKLIHENGVAGEMALSNASKKFSSITPSAVRDRGATALRILTSREIASLFGAPEPKKDTKEQYMIKVNATLSSMVSDKAIAAEAAAQLTNGIADAAPVVTSNIQQKLITGAEWLQQQIPKPKDLSALGISEYKVTDAQVNEFNQKATGVLAPALVVDNITNGTATKFQLEGLKAAYPEIYESMSQQFSLAAGENPKVTSLTKQNLGLVLGKPVTASMQSKYFKMLQGNYTKQDGPGRPKSTSKMQSLGSMYSTETNRVANRNSTP